MVPERLWCSAGSCGGDEIAGRQLCESSGCGRTEAVAFSGQGEERPLSLHGESTQPSTDFITFPIESYSIMVDLTVILTANDLANLPELRTLLATQVQMSRAEPGCIRFEAFESQTVPGTFILVERWESQAALDEHRKATACMTVYFPKVIPLVSRVPHVCSVLPGT